MSEPVPSTLLSMNLFWGESPGFASGKYGTPIRVKGTHDADFTELAQAAARASIGGTLYVSFLDYRDPETNCLFTLPLHVEPTLGQVLAVFGEEASAVPPSVSLHEGGRGGDGGALDHILEAVNATVTIGGYVSLALTGWKLALRAYYKAQRDLAKEWNDSGVISMGLRQAVLAHPVWLRSNFDSTFHLSESRAPQLLRDLGYIREDRGIVEMWVEQANA